MSPLVFFAVLFAALLHAIWNALLKISGDRLVIMAVTTATAALLVTPLLFTLPAPAPASWPFLAMSVGLHFIYMLLLVRAYGFGDFAQVYPVARGSAPLMTAILGYVFLHESMQPTELFGMLLIIGGIFSLTLERTAGILHLSHTALIYSLLTGVSIAAYSLIDGVGARLSGNSHSFAVWMFFLDGFLIPLAAFIRRPSAILKQTIQSVWRHGVIVAVLSTAGYWLVIWAFSLERIAPVAVLRETSVLFALLISFFVLKERISRIRIAIVLLIVTGILLLGI